MHPNVQEAVDTIEEALSEGDMGILFTGGKDSMVLLEMCRKHFDTTPPLLVIDTHNQFDEIYQFRKDLSDEWDLEYDVRSNTEFLEEVIWNDDDERDFAWDGFKTEGCCGALKIDIIADFISDGYGTLMVGRRAEDLNRDLDLTEAKRDPLPHRRYYPLANWSDKLVQSYIDREGIPLPELYYKGYEHTDCIDCTQMGEDGDEWSGMSQEKQDQLNQLRDMGYM